jgi:hypothetical protein
MFNAIIIHLKANKKIPRINNKNLANPKFPNKRLYSKPWLLQAELLPGLKLLKNLLPASLEQRRGPFKRIQGAIIAMISIFYE